MKKILPVAVLVAAAALASCGTTVPLAQRTTTGAPDGLDVTTTQQPTGPLREDGVGEATLPGSSPSSGGPRARGGSATPGAGTVAGTGTSTSTAAAPKTPIKIGYVIFDSTGFTAVTGNSSQEGGAAGNQAADKFEMQALVDYANATGGVNGRKIEAIPYTMQTTSGLDDAKMRATCTKATQDDKLTAFIDRSFVGSDEMLACFAKGKVNLISFLTGTSEAALARSAPYVATTQPTIERSATALGAGILSSGYLTKGAVVGVVADEGPTVDAVLTRQLLPTLKQAGFPAKVVFRTTTEDASQASSQGSAAVLKMRSEGVTHVVWFSNFLSQLGFANTASSQGYSPRYAFGDYLGGAGTAAFYLSAAQMRSAIAASALVDYIFEPDQVKGPRGLSDPVDRTTADPGVRFCLDTISKYGKRDYYNAPDRSTEWQYYCDHFLLWLQSARSAPAPFATALFQTGLRTLGASYHSTIVHATDFSTRLSGASDYRVGIYSDSGCQCYSAIGPWRRF